MIPPLLLNLITTFDVTFHVFTLYISISKQVLYIQQAYPATKNMFQKEKSVLMMKQLFYYAIINLSVSSITCIHLLITFKMKRI